MRPGGTCEGERGSDAHYYMHGERSSLRRSERGRKRPSGEQDQKSGQRHDNDTSDGNKQRS